MNMEDSRKIIPKWKNKGEFLMAALGNSIGLGNLWRFPYQCFNNGGGAFLLPYLIMTIIVGFPLVIADFAIAQYGQRGALTCWVSVPLMSGIGWAVNFMALLICTMYVAVVSLGPFYMFSSLRAKLPWASCNNTWNTPRCHSFDDIVRESHIGQSSLNFTGEYLMAQYHNSSIHQQYQLDNGTTLPPRSPSDEYFHFGLFDITPGIENIGTVRWPLCLSLIFTLVVVFGILSFGVKSWGKMSYITTLLPYVVMLALLGQSLTMSGAPEGILYFLWPKWERLDRYMVWSDAAVQSLFSLGGAGGYLIHLASHNKFKNDLVKDTIVLTVCDTMTSVLCGAVIFSIVGTMMVELDVNIDEVVGKGAGMALIVYADLLTHMPVAPAWSFVFNLMLFCLGIGPVVCSFSMVQTNILQTLPKRFRNRRVSIMILSVLIIFWFLIGLIYTTQGGMYVVQLVDGNISVFLLILCFAKTLSFGWIYGIDRLSKDINSMTGWKLHRVYWIIYKFFSPAILLVCLVVRLTSAGQLRYGSYVFPAWSQGISWALVVLLSSVIPAVALYKLFCMKRDISVKEHWTILTTPTSTWGPSSENTKDIREMKNLVAEELNPPESV